METRGLISQGHLLPCTPRGCLQVSTNSRSVRMKQRNGGRRNGMAFLQTRRDVWISLLQRRSSVVGIQSNGGQRGLVVRCNESDEVDMPVEAPAYTSYVDPHTGEASPTYGARTPLPNPAFWGEDMQRIVRSGQASTPKGETKRTPRKPARDYVSNRKNASIATRNALKSKVPNEFEEEEEEEEGEDDFVPLTKEQIAAGKELIADGGDKLWYTKNDPEHDPIKEALYQMVEEHEEEGKADEGEEDEDEEDEDEEDVPATDVAGLVSKKEGALVPTTSEAEPLANSELWWNWQKPSKDEEPWSAWHKRSGDSDSVMAAAMAKSGQIKLFAEKPSIAEASLARARKRVFYEERMREEEKRRKKVGSMAYYKEWVKSWRQDTSKEAVQQKAKKTGDGVVDQLLDMMQQQSLREYRQMQGTDIRIRRDPLSMRMSEEEVKQVWGGDPVYPTINYVQDPDCVADFRNANMHEPTPDILEQLRDDGRLITQEELQELLAKEEREAQELEGGAFDDGMTGAIDIGDKEDDDDEDEDEDEEDDEEDEDAADDNNIRNNIRNDIAWKANVSNNQQLSSGKLKVASREAKQLSPVIDLLDQIDGSDLLEYVGSEDDNDKGGEDEEDDIGELEN